MWIGVKHETLAFEAAVTAADAVKDILRQARLRSLSASRR